MKVRGLLFGLTYNYSKQSKLNGCINDVKNIERFLINKFKSDVTIRSYTDDTDVVNTSSVGIISKLYEEAIETWKSKVDLLFIHYSGHGSYIKDTNGDELDNNDEVLVPSDFEKGSFVLDDQIANVFTYINPSTKVIFLCDSCHSGTIGDLKYIWQDDQRPLIDNIRCNVAAKVMTISGCRDNQTSADAYVSGQYCGILTNTLLNILESNKESQSNIFLCLSLLRSKLKTDGFTQLPQLSTSYNLTKDTSLF